MTALKTLYEEDTVAWAEQQAAALRAAARGGSNQALDWENLAEEIESLGAAQRSALGSHVMRIIQHLVSSNILPQESRATTGGAQFGSPGCRRSGASRTVRA